MPETFDLVFRGGGIKGIAFTGALQKFVDAKHQSRRLIGTSAGAIFATGWAAGYSPADIRDRVIQRKDGKLIFASFLGSAMRPEQIPELLWKPIAATADNSLKRVIKFFPRINPDRAEGWGAKSLSLVLGAAVSDDASFRDWMADVLKAKGFEPRITLADFHSKINKARPQQLSLVAADITGQEVLVLNDRTAPALPVLEAVRMSMGIPFVWREVLWQDAWGKYRGRDLAGHSIVDGGLLSNFPMRYFLDPTFAKESGVLGPPPGGGEAPTLGLLLDGTRPMPDLPDAKEPDTLVESLPVVRLASRLLDAVLDTWDKDAMKQLIPEGKEDRYICRIATKGIGALEFDMPEERVKALINSGLCAMTEFLEKRN
jgi:predicted acylesterase/phospholipase RssA